MIPSNISPAQAAAAQIIGNWNNVVQVTEQVLKEGIPAVQPMQGRPGQSAITPKEMEAAFGVSLSKIKAMIKASKKG